MKIHAVQHIPAFVDGVDGNRADVASLDELLALPWVARWAESTVDRDVPVVVTSWPNGVETTTRETRFQKGHTFHQWSLSDHGTHRQTLMAEYDNGSYWWVVAFIASDEPLPLPEWKPTK